MPDDPQIPLRALRPSVDASFCDFPTVNDWLTFFVENIVGDGAAISSLFTNDLYFGSTEPTGTDRGKVWVKTAGSPRGLGILIDGAYVIIPVPEDVEKAQEVPNGVIVPWTGSGSVPEGWAPVSNSQATAIGLDSLNGAQYIIRSNA